MTFDTEKLEWLGYPMVKKSEGVFIRFDRMYESETGQTPHEGYGCACIASRGKNY